jgi:AcrR family transcriptional regulator
LSSLRKKIADAAQELYLREGLEGVSMRRVAEMVGVSAPAIYRHFRNKNDLLNEIVVQGLRVLEDYLRPGLDADSPYERLLNMAENYLQFALEQPRYFEIAFLVPSQDVEAIPDEIEKRNFGTFKLALAQVSACMEQGYLKKDDPLETAIIVWAAVHGLVTLYRTGRFGAEPEQFRAVYRLSVRRMLRDMMTEEGLVRVRDAGETTLRAAPPSSDGS